MRNISDKTPKTLKEELYPKIRAIFEAPDLQTARLLFSKTVEAYQDKAPKAIETLENGFDDATAVLMLPAKYRESLARLIGALLIEFDEKWSSGRRYLIWLNSNRGCGTGRHLRTR
jgi:putative transposase